MYHRRTRESERSRRSALVVAQLASESPPSGQSGAGRTPRGARTKEEDSYSYSARIQRRRVAPVFAVFALVAAAARADQIDDYVRARMKEFALPGVSLAILENGRITRIGAYGLSDRVRNTPATPATVYKIGSVSKQFVGDRDHAARPRAG